MDNANTAEYLEKIKNQVIENIRRTMHKPSVQMNDIPPNLQGMDDEADAIMNDQDEDDNPDTRHTARRWDLHIEKDGELSESEDEDALERNGIKGAGRNPRRNLRDYRNPDAVPDDEDILVAAAGTVAVTNGDARSSRGTPTPPSSRPSPPQAEDMEVEMAEEATTVPIAM